MHAPRYFVFAIAAIIAMFAKTSFAADEQQNVATARAFVADYVAKVRPLEAALSIAWWNANTSGKEEDFATKEALQNRLDAMLASAEDFAQLKKLKASELNDAQLARQINLLYLTYLAKQVDVDLLKRINSKENAIEKAFNVFRATIGKESFTAGEVDKVLQASKDSARREAIWRASKEVGAKVSGELLELVALRNQAARQLGFKNYHAMQLELNEQTQEEVLTLFDELDAMTREPFKRAKQQIDKKLAADYSIDVKALRPWHYHDLFFQEPPSVYDVDINAPFAKADIVGICKQFYDGIGLPIDDVIERSDLYERPGKSPHAFCTDIDREGDVRVLANITPTERWMSTMLHELGHAVYSSKNIPKEVPYVLRSAAHILTTEGVAMMFERFSTHADWLTEFDVEVEQPAKYTAAGRQMRRDKLLVFSRWCQVMLRFEMAMYDNPNQDLNKLWWNLVEKYQLLRRPANRDAPDYASKIHVVSAPAYYHNYMMGELFACQVHAAIARDVLKTADVSSAYYTRNRAVGRFMTEKVFAPGQSMPWNELTVHATGERLGSKAFAEELED